jgi:hypothetical protein
VLSPHGVEQHTMLHAVFGEKKLADLPAYHALLKMFTTLEVVRWPVLQATYGAEMAAQTGRPQGPIEIPIEFKGAS